MLDKLPQFIDPVSFADKQRVLVGHIPLAKFTRLADMLQNTRGAVAIDFSFGKEDRRSVIRGHIKADLSLVCRTCLEAVDFPVNIAVNLAVVQTLEQADRLAGQHEPLLLEEEKVALHELVEDELLLVLPDFPRHQQECVPYKQNATEDVAVVDSRQTPSTNPFSVLAKLKPIGD
jgi:uncharacterized protein